MAGSGDEVADLDPACLLARPRQGKRAGEVDGHIVVAESRYQGRSSGCGDRIQAEDVPDEGRLAGGIEVKRPCPCRRRHRRDPELHERPDSGDDHVGWLEEPTEAGGGGDIGFDRWELGFETVSYGQHLGAVSSDQGGLFAACEEFPEHSLPGIPSCAQQYDPAFVHDVTVLDFWPAPSG
jgi:hypothetical protein